jgi:hypothetical protein
MMRTLAWLFFLRGLLFDFFVFFFINLSKISVEYLYFYPPPSPMCANVCNPCAFFLQRHTATLLLEYREAQYFI